MGRVEYPDWVPDAVRKAADDFLGADALDNDDLNVEAIALRLVTAPEMKTVWQRLGKFSPNEARWRARGCTLDDALVGFFETAYRGFWAPDSEELRQMNSEAWREFELASQLRQKAEEWGQGNEAAQALGRAAKYLERSANWTILQLESVPGERGRGQNYMRSYAVRLAQLASGF